MRIGTSVLQVCLVLLVSAGGQSDSQSTNVTTCEDLPVNAIIYLVDEAIGSDSFSIGWYTSISCEVISKPLDGSLTEHQILMHIMALLGVPLAHFDCSLSMARICEGSAALGWRDKGDCAQYENVSLNSGCCKSCRGLRTGYNTPWGPSDGDRFKYRLAFVEFLDGLGYPNESKVSEDPCDWDGMQCRLEEGWFVKLILDSANLTLNGSLSHAALSKIDGVALEFFQGMDISGHSIHGEVPESVVGLSALETLNLAGNRLTGSLPSRGFTLYRLREVDVSSNFLSGEVPNAWAAIDTVSSYNISHNLFHGQHPDMSGLLTAESIDISSNNFSGLLPQLPWSSALRTLDASHNALTGVTGPLDWPDTCGSTETRIHLDGNLLVEIPWRVMPRVVQLTLSNNRIASLPSWTCITQPAYIADLKALGAGQLGADAQTYCPISLMNGNCAYVDWPALVTLHLSNNPIGVTTSEMLHFLGHASRIVSFECSNCSLSGPIDESVNFHYAVVNNSLVGCGLRRVRSFPQLTALDLSVNPEVQCDVITFQASVVGIGCGQCEPFAEPAGPTPLGNFDVCRCIDGLVDYATQLCGCPGGTFLNRAELKCADCGEGEDCAWGNDYVRSRYPPPIKKGYWSAPVLDWANFSGHSVYACASEEVCRGYLHQDSLTSLAIPFGIEFAVNCAAGRSGVACADCKPLHFPLDNESPCERCKSPELSRLLIFLGMAFAVPIIMIMIRLLHDDTHRAQAMCILSLRTSVRILGKHLQSLGVIAGFQQSWPPEVKAWVKALQIFRLLPRIFNAFGDAQPSVSCMMRDSSYAVTLGTRWFLPSLVLILVGCAWLFSNLLTSLHVLLHACLPKRWIVCRQRWEALRVERLHRKHCFSFLFLIWSICFGTLVADALEVLSCAPGPNQKWMVQTATNIECFEGDWFLFIPGAIAAMLCHVVLFIAVQIYAHHRVTLRFPATNFGSYGIAVEGYRTRELHWPIYISILELLLSSHALFYSLLFQDAGTQLMSAACIVACYSYAASARRPFDSAAANRMDFAAGIARAGLLAFTSALGFEDGVEAVDVAEQGDAYEERARLLLAIFLIGLVVPFFYVARDFLYAFDFFRRRLDRLIACVWPARQKDPEEIRQELLRHIHSLGQIIAGVDIIELHQLERAVNDSAIGIRCFSVAGRTGGLSSSLQNPLDNLTRCRLAAAGVEGDHDADNRHSKSSGDIQTRSTLDIDEIAKIEDFSGAGG